MAIEHAVLIQMPNVNLNRGMVLCSNQPVGGRTAFTKPLFIQKTKQNTFEKYKNPKTSTTKNGNKRKYHFLGM
jgi:hypothetical protein